jgi:hypothetical protein
MSDQDDRISFRLLTAADVGVGPIGVLSQTFWTIPYRGIQILFNDNILWITSCYYLLCDSGS